MTSENTAHPELSQSDDWLGKVISGKFRVVRLLGRGGMGCVYEAVNIKLGRRVALKRILPVHMTNAEIVSRFEMEAKAAGGLLHENILAVTDFERAEDGTPYLVMELLEGQSLSALLKRVPFLDSRSALGLVVQACRGLAKAHEAGIVHRDLKPANIFLCQRADGTELVKILDFGIAKLKGAPPDGENTTRPGSIIGTPKYMSPEQARGDLAIDARTDVHALGVILYEALSNKLPHPGINDAQVLYHLQTTDPIPLSQHRPDLPAALCAVVAEALASDPDKRIPSAQALEQALLDVCCEPCARAADGGATRAAGDCDGAGYGQLAASPNPVGAETTSPVQITKSVTSRSLGFAVILVSVGMSILIASWRIAPHSLVHVAAVQSNPAQRQAAPASAASSIPIQTTAAPSSGMESTALTDSTSAPLPATSVTVAHSSSPSNERREVSTRTVHGHSPAARLRVSAVSSAGPATQHEAPELPRSAPGVDDVWGKIPY